MFGESSVVGEVESCEQGFWIIQCQGMKPSRASRGSLDDRNTRTNRGMGVDRVKLLLATAGLLHYGWQWRAALTTRECSSVPVFCPF
jgi:hypothetical protein